MTIYSNPFYSYVSLLSVHWIGICSMSLYLGVSYKPMLSGALFILHLFINSPSGLKSSHLKLTMTQLRSKPGVFTIYDSSYLLSPDQRIIDLILPKIKMQYTITHRPSIINRITPPSCFQSIIWVWLVEEWGFL